MLAIDWRHDGRRIVVPISIFAPAPSNELTGVHGSALLDTGSTTSEITKSVAASLGLVGRGKRVLASAQGEGQAERYLFRVGLWPDRADAAPAFPFLFEEVIGFELANSFQFQALLGMDILRRCDFSMDRSGGCRLRFG
jgi:hypothetical protein